MNPLEVLLLEGTAGFPTSLPCPSTPHPTPRPERTPLFHIPTKDLLAAALCGLWLQRERLGGNKDEGNTAALPFTLKASACLVALPFTLKANTCPQYLAPATPLMPSSAPRK